MGFYTPPAQSGNPDPAINVSRLHTTLSDAASAGFQKTLEMEGTSSIYKNWELGNIRESVLTEAYRDALFQNDLRTVSKLNPVFGPFDVVREYFNPSFIEQVRDGEIDFLDPRYRGSARPDIEFLTADEANEEGADVGLDNFKNTVSRTEFSFLRKLKIEENRLNHRISMVRDQFGSGTVMFASSVAGAVVDPINLASSFIPVYGQAKWARVVNSVFKHGVAQRALTSKAGTRFFTGAGNAFVGNLAIEPIIYKNQQEFQGDYTMVDSLNALTLGTLIGGGLHLGIGYLGDALGRPTSHNRRDGKPLSDYRMVFSSTKELPPPTGPGPRPMQPGDVQFMPWLELPAPAKPSEEIIPTHILEEEINHGFGMQMERFASPEERNAFMALAVDSVINGRFPKLENLVEYSPNIKQFEAVDLTDMPLKIQVTKLSGGRVQVAFTTQHPEISVPPQTGENFDDAASKLIGAFIHNKRRSTKPAVFAPTDFTKVNGVPSTYANGRWLIEKRGKVWTLVDEEGRVHGEYTTLTQAKESNRFLPEGEFKGTAQDLQIKQLEQIKRLEHEEKLANIAKQLEELNSPEAFRAKLIELGYPIQRFEKAAAEIEYRRTEGRQQVIARASEGKGRKRLRLYDEETDQKVKVLKLARNIADEGRHEKAKVILSNEKRALRREAAQLKQALGKEDKAPKPMSEYDIEAEARAIKEAKSWLDDQQVVLEVAEKLKLPEKFLVRDERLTTTQTKGKAVEGPRTKEEMTPLMKEILEDTEDTLTEVAEQAELLGLNSKELGDLDGLAQGAEAPRVTQDAPVKDTSRKLVNATTINSFDDRLMDVIAKDAGFENMADFRSKVMANPDNVKEMELPTELRSAIKDTLDRQQTIQYAMDRGATADDLIEAGKRGDDLHEKIPQNEYDVEISLSKAARQLIKEYINCRKV
jgi:hypothetical protein